MPRSKVGVKSAGSDPGSPTLQGYFPITIYSESGPATVTDIIVIDLDDVFPPGMKFRIIGSSLSASVLSAGTVTVDIGTAVDPNKYIVAQAIAAAGSEYTKVTGVGVADATVGDFEFDPAATVADDATLQVTINLAAAVYEGLILILWAVPTAHDSDIAGR